MYWHWDHRRFLLKNHKEINNDVEIRNVEFETWWFYPSLYQSRTVHRIMSSPRRCLSTLATPFVRSRNSGESEKRTHIWSFPSHLNPFSMSGISPEENIGTGVDTRLTTGIYGAGIVSEDFLLLLSISKENMDSKVSHGCSLYVDSSRAGDNALAGYLGSQIHLDNSPFSE